MEAKSEKNLKEPSVSEIVSKLFRSRIKKHQVNSSKESQPYIHHREFH